jgi:hypothetical protein
MLAKVKLKRLTLYVHSASHFVGTSPTYKHNITAIKKVEPKSKYLSFVGVETYMGPYHIPYTVIEAIGTGRLPIRTTSQGGGRRTDLID